MRWFPEVKKAENFPDDARLFRTEMSNYETWSSLLDCKGNSLCLMFSKSNRAFWVGLFMDKIGSKQTKTRHPPRWCHKDKNKNFSSGEVQGDNTASKIKTQDQENETRANGDSRRPAVYSLPAASPTRIQMLSGTFSSWRSGVESKSVWQWFLRGQRDLAKVAITWSQSKKNDFQATYLLIY